MTATVDLVRFDQGKSKNGRWHIANGDVTLCNFAVPDTAVVERGLDAHVIQFRGKSVCARCRARVTYGVAA